MASSCTSMTALAVSRKGLPKIIVSLLSSISKTTKSTGKEMQNYQVPQGVRDINQNACLMVISAISKLESHGSQPCIT